MSKKKTIGEKEFKEALQTVSDFCGVDMGALHERIKATQMKGGEVQVTVWYGNKVKLTVGKSDALLNEKDLRSFEKVIGQAKKQILKNKLSPGFAGKM